MQVKLNAGKLKAIRKARKLTQSGLAEQSGSTDRYIRDLESGRKDNPSAALLFQMCSALGVSMDELMEIRENQ